MLYFVRMCIFVYGVEVFTLSNVLFMEGRFRESCGMVSAVMCDSVYIGIVC